MKALYCGDNLQVLRDSIATESVDLIYLDPPFDSNATYKLGCRGQSGRDRMRGRTAACSQKPPFERAAVTIEFRPHRCYYRAGRRMPWSGVSLP